MVGRQEKCTRVTIATLDQLFIKNVCETGQNRISKRTTGQQAPRLSQGPDDNTCGPFCTCPDTPASMHVSTNSPSECTVTNTNFAVEPDSRSLCIASIPFKIGMLMSV